MHNVFIDANVIANWMFFKNLLREKKSAQERSDFLEDHKAGKKKFTTRIYESYIFMEQNVLKKQKSFVFWISPLIITEVFNALFENHALEYMKRSYLPLYMQHDVRKRPFAEGTYGQIYGEHKKDINQLEKYVKMIYEKDAKVPVLSAAFITEWGLKSQDAHIMGQAVNGDCNYIITNDEELIEKFSKQNDFEIISLKPASFSNHFSKALNKGSISKKTN